MKNGLEVFDFKEEDELPEFVAGKILEKLKNPSSDASPILKYQLVQNFSQGNDVQEKEGCHVPHVDVNANDDSDHSFEKATASDAEEETLELDVASKLNSESHEQCPQFQQHSNKSRSFCPELELINSCHELPSPQGNKLNCALSDSPSNNEPVDLVSGDNENTKGHCPTKPASDAQDDVSLKGQTTGNCSGDLEMAEINVAVVILPDFVVVRNRYSTAALVTFSNDGIKIKGSSKCDSKGAFTFEWGVDDIIHIGCERFQKVGLVILKLHVLSKDAIQAEEACGTSGIEELKFAVPDLNWSERQEEITSLNVKYQAVWDFVLDEDTNMNGEDLCQQRHYFPNFDEPFEEVIYPKGDSDAVSICKRDVDLLQPETFINDTIIDFYIKYLKNQIPSEEKHRFHFFNSFFFRKLADLDKDPSSISDGKAAFLRVHKWTRKVDIFGKDYIFIPVNFNLHWSLIVICHLGEVASFRDEDLDNSSRIPCILHMDSIKGSHAGLKNLVQSYLCEEWKERHKETSEAISSKFLNLRFVALELPQQENSFDCGLFLLHYLELFLAEAPVNFSPFKITKFSNFLNVDWFPPFEASLKRTLIQKLIFELLEKRTREAMSDSHQSSKSPENNVNETGVEFISERCSPSAACHRNLSQAAQGIEMTLLEASSVRDFNSINDSGVVLRELFDPGATAGSLLGQFQSFDQSTSFYHLNGTLLPREQEDAETSLHLVYLTSGESNFQQISGAAAPTGADSFSSRGFGAELSWNPEILIQGEHEIGSSEPSSASDDSDVGIIECNVVESEKTEEANLVQSEKTEEANLGKSEKMEEANLIESEETEEVNLVKSEKTEYVTPPSAKLVEPLTEGPVLVPGELPENSVIEGSCDPVEIHNSSENGEPEPEKEYPAALGEKRLHEDTKPIDNPILPDMVMNAGTLLESDEIQAAKRLRLTPPVDGDEEAGNHGSLSEDLHL